MSPSGDPGRTGGPTRVANLAWFLRTTFAERLMFKSHWLSTLAVAGLTLVATGCGSAGRETRPRSIPAPPVAQAPPAPVAPAIDPIQALIDESQKHYLSGQRELEVGHIDRARVEFDRAIDVLLAAPGGARAEPRLREQFDRLVDRISALEVATLAEGDGFSEKPSEPA
jgi:hypothetical protein